MWFCTNSLSSALAKLSVISASVQSGEYDFDGSREEKPAQPIFVRAEEVKNEIKDATQLKYKLEAKDIDIKDLKKEYDWTFNLLPYRRYTIYQCRQL